MSHEPTAFDRTTIEAIAREVAKLLDRRPDEELLTARDVAARFNVHPGWVYAHADELGVIRLGEGARPPLRFDAAVVAQRLLPRPAGARPSRPTPRYSQSGPLLPIRSSRSRRNLGAA